MLHRNHLILDIIVDYNEIKAEQFVFSGTASVSSFIPKLWRLLKEGPQKETSVNI